VGHLTLAQPPAITLPWTALTALAGAPAVWVVDPSTMQAGQVAVTVSAYGNDTVRVTDGVAPGALVVTDGSQLLFPGRVVVTPAEAQP
jgi:multidrug efflux pump subunit AcrA (membrane-fusion protein)